MRSPEVIETDRRPSGFVSKAKTAFATLLLMALTGAIGYGAALWQMRSQGERVYTSQKKTIAQLEGQIKQAETIAQAAAARSQLSEVRFGLLESVNELSANNFGTANTRLRAASDLLNTVSVAKDPVKLETLKKDLAAEEINFAINPVEQRRKLLDYANQLNVLLPEAPPAPEAAKAVEPEIEQGVEAETAPKSSPRPTQPKPQKP